MPPLLALGRSSKIFRHFSVLNLTIVILLTLRYGIASASRQRVNPAIVPVQRESFSATILYPAIPAPLSCEYCCGLLLPQSVYCTTNATANGIENRPIDSAMSVAAQAHIARYQALSR